MANKNTKKITIICSLAILGIERPREIIATLSPLFLEITLKGRKTLRILSDFRNGTDSPRTVLKSAEATMMKSKMFHESRIKLSGPLKKKPTAMTFKATSNVKIQVITRSI